MKQSQDIFLWLTKATTWGQSSNGIDVRTLRTFNRLLDRLCCVGEGIAVAMLLLLIAVCAWLLTAQSYENIIFFDGTDHVCVFDGKNVIYYGGGN